MELSLAALRTKVGPERARLVKGAAGEATLLSWMALENPNGKNGNGKKKKPTLTDYDTGYRDGYLEGLTECGPLAGFTQWWSRRAKTEKLGDMKETERMAIVRQAVAQYESLGAGTKKKLLEMNPSMDTHNSKSIAKNLNSISRELLKKSKASYKKKDLDEAFTHAIRALASAGAGLGYAASAGAHDLGKKLGETVDGAKEYLHYMAGYAEINPASQAGAAALGGIAGAVLLGPLGAAVGGYAAVKGRKKLKERVKARKRKGREKNPSVGRLVSSALK